MLKKDKSIISVAALTFVIILFEAFWLYKQGKVIYFSFSFLLPMILLLVYLKTRDFKVIIQDWLIFILAMSAINLLRTMVVIWTSHAKIPAHNDLMINFEYKIGAGQLFIARLQHFFLQPHHHVNFIIKISLLVYGLHWVYFLFIGYILWRYRPEQFKLYKIALCLLFLIGTVIHLIYPTAPPWIAQQFGFFEKNTLIDFFTAERVEISKKILGALTGNIFGAWPSMHVGIECLCSCFIINAFGWRKGFISVIYTLLVTFACFFLAQHYVLDALTGALLAIAVFWIISHTRIQQYIINKNNSRSQKHTLYRNILFLYACLFIIAVETNISIHFLSNLKFSFYRSGRLIYTKLTPLQK